LNQLQKQIQSIQNSANNDPRFKQNQEIVITQEAVSYVEKLFNSMLPHFPAWRQSCPTDEDLGRLKSAWTKAIMRNSIKTGKKLNVKAGLLACEESESDWLPSVGKFIKWCDQSSDVMPFAQRGLDLFNSGQKQIDSVGKMVTGKHGFDLKTMKATETNKRFIELYLMYAENNEIQALESNLLTETVQLSKEQQKDADKRALDAQNQFLNQFSNLIDEKEEVKPINVESGVKTGSLKVKVKSEKEIEDSRQRQLAMIKGRYNG